MVASFGDRLAGRGGLSQVDVDTVLPSLVTAHDDLNFDMDEENAQLVVIPISQEIAPDFQLIGYDDTIRRIEEILTQRGKQRNVMLYGDNGVGKDHPYSLVVPTPKGDRKWGNLQVGDQLFGLDGYSTFITGRHEQGTKPTYQISFDDGTSTLAGLEHLWRVRGFHNHHKRENCEWETLTTAQIMSRGVRKKHGSSNMRQFEVPRSKAVSFPSRGVAITPYCLGVWLGDGHAGSSRYSKPDLDIVERIREHYIVTENVNGDCPCWYISGIADALHDYGLFDCRSYERFVPSCYLENDIEVRSEILRGLMDTDGWVNPDGSIQFSSSSKLLADQVAWLMRSLGGKAHRSDKTNCGYRDDNGTFVPCRDAYVVTLCPPEDFEIFHLPRKAILTRDVVQSRYLTRWIEKIEYSHDEPSMCVTVSAEDSLYLVNDFIPTHNTAIIQGLVQRKNRGDLSTHMFKRMFYRLNNSRLLHMDDVTEINKQFDQAIEEFGRYDVMVIENFYTLMTYLKLKNATVVLVALLEALSRRKLQAIITCSSRERTLINNEMPEVHEYFLPEKIIEPNDEQLRAILRGVHSSFENRYDITIPDDALCTIADLTQKYRTGMEGWAQPGRALILLDRSISQFSVRMNSRSPELAALETELANAENEIDAGSESVRPIDVERRKFLMERVADARPKVDRLRQQWVETTAPIQALQTEKSVLDKKLHALINKRRRLTEMRGDVKALIANNTDASKTSDNLDLTNRMIDRVREGIREIDDKLGKINLSEIRDHVVTSEHVSTTFSELTGISASQLKQDMRERLLNMENILRQRVVGQEPALKAVADAVRAEKALKMKDPGPRGKFLFLGPSGVGKTEICKALAAFLYADEKAMVRINMTDFMEKHNVSRLVGAPPGYAGYDEGGVLTNAVQARPQCVVLFDEVEKAHEDVFNILLSAFSDGVLQDGRGQDTFFNETYCGLTSNLGKHHFTNPALTFEQASALAIVDVKKFFTTEFLGRLDAIICFQRLEVPMLVKVAEKRVRAISDSIKADRLTLDFPESEITTFCTVYQDPDYGARPIVTNMKKHLESELAMQILKREGNDPGVFHVKMVDDELQVALT